MPPGAENRLIALLAHRDRVNPLHDELAADGAAVRWRTDPRSQRVDANQDGSSEGDAMNSVKIAAIALIIAGVLALAYGGFSYTKETHQATLGPIKLSVEEKQTVNVPIWAGVGAVVIGGVLLLLGSKKD
jgi:uncharacterized membrane protein YidH (DUF202 family)